MKLLDIYDNFIIDLDGVVYIGEKLIIGAGDTLDALRKAGKGIIFLTNDPRGSSRNYSDKLNGMKITARPEDVVTSAMALALFIKENFQVEGKRAYVVGSPILKAEIEEMGLRLSDGEAAKSADFVIVGGHQEFNYYEMKLATLALRNGAHFFATNRDAAFPTPEGLVPATGAILASIEVASGRRAVTVGKPEPIVFEVAKKLFNSGKRVVVVGDRLDTDVLGGMRAGIDTILVLSGSTSEVELSQSKILPDYVIADLRDLLKERKRLPHPLK